MADLSYPKAFTNLRKYDEKTAKLVLQLYNQVSDTLKELIVDNDIGLRKAQKLLLEEYNKALISTDFIASWQSSTVNVIVQSSFLENVPIATKQGWGDYLWNKSMFDDKIKLSTRIRMNGANIISAQKKALRESLKSGKTVAQIIGNINDDTIKGFTRELPKYMKELKGAGLNTKQLSAVRKQVSKIKTAGLRADYNRLIDAIELGKGVDKATYFAMERKTKFYASRLARTETLNSMAMVRNHEAMQDPDTQWVKSVTQGSNPCPYCIAVENIGYVPVANATIPSHHPHCSCRAEYKRSIKRPDKWSNAEYKGKLQTEIDKLNRKAERLGTPKTYLSPESPSNLRGAGDLLGEFS